VRDVRLGAHRARRRHQRLLDRQLPVLAATLASSVHSGANLAMALEDAADASPEPSAASMAALRAAIDRGVPADRALSDWASAESHPGVSLLVTSVRLGQEHGGDLGVALDAVSASLLDRVEVADEARALASQARSSAAVLVALPPFGALCFCLLDPAVAATLFTTPVGWACLIIGGGLDAIGAWVLTRMVDRAVVDPGDVTRSRDATGPWDATGSWDGNHLGDVTEFDHVAGAGVAGVGR